SQGANGDVTHITDGNLHVRQRLTDGSAQIRVTIIPPGKCNRERLRLPINDLNGRSEYLPRFAHEFGRYHRPATHHASNGSGIAAVSFRKLHKSADHRRDTQKEVRAFAFDHASQHFGIVTTCEK